MMASHESLFHAALNHDRRKRREKRTDVLARIITNIFMAFIGGWELMLAVGVAHHEWLPGLPTIGYWWAVVLVALLRGAFDTARSTASDR